MVRPRSPDTPRARGPWPAAGRLSSGPEEVDDRAQATFQEAAQNLGEDGVVVTGHHVVRATHITELGVDELSLGLAPLVVTRLLEAVRAAADSGIGVMLVEQHIDQALVIADHALVLRRGQIVLAGPAAQVAERRAQVEASYLLS